MPDRGKCTCVPQQIRAIQRTCFTAQTELQTIEDRLEAARRGVTLPLHADRIFDGDAPPTVSTEVYGSISVLVDDHIPEMRRILQEAATATPRRVTMAWNRLQLSIRRAKAEASIQDTSPDDTDSRNGTPTADPDLIEN